MSVKLLQVTVPPAAVGKEWPANSSEFRFLRLLNTGAYPAPAGYSLQIQPRIADVAVDFFPFDSRNRYTLGGRQADNFNMKASVAGDYWFLTSMDDELIQDFDVATLVAAVDTSALAKDATLVVINTNVANLLSYARNWQLVGSGQGNQGAAGDVDQAFMNWGGQNMQITLNLTAVAGGGSVQVSVLATDAQNNDTLLIAFGAEAANGNFTYNLGPALTTAGRNAGLVVPVAGKIRMTKVGAGSVYGWGGSITH